MGRIRFIVSRDRPDIYEYLMSHFAGEKDVEVILDRRRKGRQDVPAQEPERRRADTTERGDPFALSEVITHVQVEKPVPAHSRLLHASSNVGRPPELPAAPSGRAILVVDDNPEITNLWVELFSLDGHEVETAANGVIALAKLRERAYDLILCDLKMPELDGPGLYREVERRYPELRDRFIFVTGSPLDAESQKFLEQTTVPYLCKPVELDEIRRVVERASRRV